MPWQYFCLRHDTPTAGVFGVMGAVFPAHKVTQEDVSMLVLALVVPSTFAVQQATDIFFFVFQVIPKFHAQRLGYCFVGCLGVAPACPMWVSSTTLSRSGTAPEKADALQRTDPFYVHVQGVLCCMELVFVSQHEP